MSRLILIKNRKYSMTTKVMCPKELHRKVKVIINNCKIKRPVKYSYRLKKFVILYSVTQPETKYCFSPASTVQKAIQFKKKFKRNRFKKSSKRGSNELQQ